MSLCLETDCGWSIGRFESGFACLGRLDEFGGLGV